MVAVPGGRFVMGAERGEAGRPEGPPRTIDVRAFALGRTEVTHRQFAAFVAATGHRPASRCRTSIGGQWTTAEGYDWRRPRPGMTPRASDPVTCVSWQDAAAYATWLASVTGQPYRLPSEAEWEYAARAGASGDLPWPDDPAACRLANVYDRDGQRQLKLDWPPAPCADGAAGVARVARYPANGFGLHDMIGNVWEWTRDCYVAPYPAGGDADAVEPSAGELCAQRTVRGGSWMTRLDRHRFTFRGRDPEKAAFVYFGFRVARDRTAPPTVERVSLVVSDLERALTLYRDIIGYRPVGLPVANMSAIGEALRLPAGSPLRFLRLDGVGQAQLGLIESRRLDRSRSAGIVLVLRVSGLTAKIASLQHQGLKPGVARTIRTGDGQAVREVSVVDHDGHVLLLREAR